MSFRSKPVGWRFDSARHSLAARGIRSYRASKTSRLVDVAISRGIYAREVEDDGEDVFTLQTGGREAMSSSINEQVRKLKNRQDPDVRRRGTEELEMDLRRARRDGYKWVKGPKENILANTPGGELLAKEEDIERSIRSVAKKEGIKDTSSLSAEVREIEPEKDAGVVYDYVTQRLRNEINENVEKRRDMKKDVRAEIGFVILERPQSLRRGK